MSLRMDEIRKRIVFDHLSPENPSLNGIRSFYVPDFSYDAYVWNEDRFELYEDVIAINDEKDEKSSEIYVLNPNTGKPKNRNFLWNGLVLTTQTIQVVGTMCQEHRKPRKQK